MLLNLPPILMKSILAIILSCANLEAKSIVTEDLVHKVGIIESNLNSEAVGDYGDSIGAFQIGQRAWADAVAYSRIVGHPYDLTLPECWKDNAKFYETAHRAATLILLMHEERMIKNKIKPTPFKLYMAYNMGFVGAYQHNFDIKQTSGLRRAILVRALNILSR